MAELYGAPVGQLAYEENLRQNLAAIASTEKIKEEVQTAPFTRRLLSAQARTAEKKITDAEELEAMARQAAPSLEGADTETRLRALADVALKAGKVEEGAALAKAASDLGMVRAQTTAQRAASYGQYLKNVVSEAEMIGQLLGDVKDEEGWKQANQLWEIQTGKPSVYKDLPYSPALVEGLTQMAISAKDRATLAINEQQVADKFNFDNRRLQQFDEANRINALRARIMKDREERLKKSGGGKRITSPSFEEIHQARTVIKGAYPNFSKEELDYESFKLAAEGRELTTNNTALNTEQGIAQAFKAAVERGDYIQRNRYKWLPGGMGPKETGPRTKPGEAGEGTIKPPGSSPAPAPAPAPAPKEEKGSTFTFPELPGKREEWKPGGVYNSNKGIIFWDGKQGTRVHQPKTPAEAEKLPPGTLYMTPDWKPGDKLYRR